MLKIHKVELTPKYNIHKIIRQIETIGDWNKTEIKKMNFSNEAFNSAQRRVSIK